MRAVTLLRLAVWLVVLSSCVAGPASAEDVPTCKQDSTHCKESLRVIHCGGGQTEQFSLSLDFPKDPPTRSADQATPWTSFDFRVERDQEKYLLALRDYVYEGNLEVDWQGQRNPVRTWYHAPWMHWGDSGRECLRGLTRERRSRPGELHQQQKERVQNWGIALYNPVGAHTLGRVWPQTSSAPKPQAAKFSPGAVSVKLLFTEARPDQVPYLEGSKVWSAWIHKDPNHPGQGRRKADLRLLQMDIAVRDPRADCATGWVFATYTYDVDEKVDPTVLVERVPWLKMVPVGLAWGNDPEDSSVESGAPSGRLWENAILPWRFCDRPSFLGWGGRLNGPVDNRRSGCVSCHSTAQFPQLPPELPRDVMVAPMKPWFRNLKGDESFSSGTYPLDYSLQLAVGIFNFCEARKKDCFCKNLPERVLVNRSWKAFVLPWLAEGRVYGPGEVLRGDPDPEHQAEKWPRVSWLWIWLGAILLVLLLMGSGGAAGWKRRGIVERRRQK